MRINSVIMAASPDAIGVRSSVKYIIMKRIAKIVCLGFVLFISVHSSARAGINANENPSTFDWSRVIEAIISVESEGNPNAVSGNSCGAMQITPILVKECNLILARRRSKKRFSLRDRFSVEKSKEMFLLIQSYHNPENNIEKAIRAWNGGQRYSVRRTQRYYNKVMRRMK